METEQRVIVTLDINGHSRVSFTTELGWTNKFNVQWEAITPESALAEVVERITSLSAVPYMNLADNQEVANGVNARLLEGSAGITDTITAALHEAVDEGGLRKINLVIENALDISLIFEPDDIVQYGEEKKEQVGSMFLWEEEKEVAAEKSTQLESQGNLHWNLIVRTKVGSISSAKLEEHGAKTNTCRVYIGRPKTYGELVDLIDGNWYTLTATDSIDAVALMRSSSDLKSELQLLIVDHLGTGSDTSIVTPEDIRLVASDERMCMELVWEDRDAQEEEV